MAKSQRILHVTSVGSSAADEVSRLGFDSSAQMVQAIAGVVSPKYRVTAAAKIIVTPVKEERGGRADDAARAADVQTALADDNVAALVCIRGGAWFVRTLPM